MLSVQGTFDGKKLKLNRELKIRSAKKVIVTFLDDADEDITNEELLMLADKGGAFDFLKNKEEDIYTDKDLKVKYK